MEIRDQVFIVTGGASGLGAGTARTLAEAGGKVVIADLNETAGTALAQELGGRFVRCDVASEADGQAVVEAATSLGTLRGLVNCAGIATASRTVGKTGPHPLDQFARCEVGDAVATVGVGVRAQRGAGVQRAVGDHLVRADGKQAPGALHHVPRSQPETRGAVEMVAVDAELAPGIEDYDLPLLVPAPAARLCLRRHDLPPEVLGHLRHPPYP